MSNTGITKDTQYNITMRKYKMHTIYQYNSMLLCNNILNRPKKLIIFIKLNYMGT